MAHPALRVPRRTSVFSTLTRTSQSSSSICLRCQSRQTSQPRRHLTTSRPSRAPQGAGQPQVAGASRHKSQQSMSNHMKNITKEQMGNEFGRIPDTFIVPLAKDLPPWLGSSWKRRARIQWFRTMNSLRSFVALFHFCKWDVKKDPITGRSVSRKMYLSERLAVARDLQTQLYTNVASGDLKALKAIACDGLYEYCRTRIARRNSRGVTAEKWEILKRDGLTLPRFLERWPISSLVPFTSERVLSDRMVMLPKRDSYLRQVVVRLHSKQNIKRWAGQKLTYDHPGKLSENLVIQKIIFNGEEGPWMIWGTVDPTSDEEIDKLLAAGKKSGTASWTEDIRGRIAAATGL